MSAVLFTIEPETARNLERLDEIAFRLNEYLDAGFLTLLNKAITVKLPEETGRALVMHRPVDSELTVLIELAWNAGAEQWQEVSRVSFPTWGMRTAAQMLLHVTAC